MKTTLKLAAWLVGTVTLLAAAPARADDWPCTVLLCLSDPRGPETEAGCVPPIERLWQELLSFHPFPTCVMQGPNGKSWAQQGMSYYDPCPDGTTALSSGQMAIQGAASDSGRFFSSNDRTLRTGIGTGDDLTPGTGDNYAPLPGKTCVGQRLGSAVVNVTTGTGDSSDSENYIADIYDRVVMLSPASSPRIIDVFIDDRLARRVRW